MPVLCMEVEPKFTKFDHIERYYLIMIDTYIYAE
jgi:hypothetical protein